MKYFKQTAFAFILILVFLFQSSPFFSHYIHFRTVKPDFLHILLVFTAFYFGTRYTLIVILLTGLFIDLISNSPNGFYMITGFLSVLPVFYIKNKFHTEKLSLFMITVMVTTLLKCLLTVFFIKILGYHEGVLRYLRLVVIPETILNTLTAFPVYLFFAIFQFNKVLSKET